MNKVKKIVATSTAAVAVGVGALFIAPQSASAVGQYGCSSDIFIPQTGNITGNSVNLRSGPSTSYASKGLMSKGTDFYYYCHKSVSGPDWLYGKVKSGPNAGKWGWTTSSYVKLPYGR